MLAAAIEDAVLQEDAPGLVTERVDLSKSRQDWVDGCSSAVISCCNTYPSKMVGCGQTTVWAMAKTATRPTIG